MSNYGGSGSNEEFSTKSPLTKRFQSKIKTSNNNSMLATSLKKNAVNLSLNNSSLLRRTQDNGSYINEHSRKTKGDDIHKKMYNKALRIMRATEEIEELMNN